MYRKLSLFLFTTLLTVCSLHTMEQDSQPAAEAPYMPQTACPHPVYLINNSNQDLDIVITTGPNIVTEQNAHILNTIIAGLTVALPCNLGEITDQAIARKFKSARFQFTIKPHDNLMLPGIATGQKITLWKKRLGTDVIPYELPIQKIESLVTSIRQNQDQKSIVKVFVTPSPSIGFDFQLCVAQQENHNLNPAVKQEAPAMAIGMEFPVSLYPVKLFNNTQESLDITLVANPSGVTAKNGSILQLVLVAFTTSLNIDDMNGISAHNIQDKFKKAEFDFTIEANDNLLLPGIAAGQEIKVWKKRLHTNITFYPLPLNSIEQAVKTIDLHKTSATTKNTVNVFITPGYVYGFNFGVAVLQQS